MLSYPTSFYVNNLRIKHAISEGSVCTNYFNLLLNNVALVPSLWTWNSIERCSALWEKYTRLVSAAGGIVYNDYDEILVIFRNSKWDLPKGKIEHKENMRQAAIREVFEETGVSATCTNTQPVETFHLYKHTTEAGIFILKKTSWFVMKSTKNDNILRPQKEEGIEKVQWMNKWMWKEYRPHAYVMIADLIDEHTIW